MPTSYVVVRDRSGGVPWCNATGKTAGEAWLKVARRMVEYDAEQAENQRVLDAAIDELTDSHGTSMGIKAAALRYAAVLIDQSDIAYRDERSRWSEALRKMADRGTK